MALITCPECGSKISDKAQTCIHCGNIMKRNTKVKLKILRFPTGLLNHKSVKAEVYVDGQLVWEGDSGLVATFEVRGEATVIVRLIKAYTGHLFPPFKTFEIKGTVVAGNNYEMKCTERSLFFGDITKSKYVFSEVDVIDSGV